MGELFMVVGIKPSCTFARVGRQEARRDRHSAKIEKKNKLEAGCY